MDPTNRRIRKIDRDAQRFVSLALGNTDLTLSDYDMIHTVQHRPGITQEQLRQKYGQDKSTIARRAAKLEAGGYIERRPHPGDGRRKQLYITDKGRAIRNAKVEAESFYFEWLTAELTPEELAVLCPLLDGHGRMFAHITVDPGCSIGYHDHQHETEFYYIIKGEAVFNDDGREVLVHAGDICATGYGASHGLENKTDEPVELIALIVME